jgi:hypothetical protein
MVWIALAIAGLALAGVIGWYIAATNVETPAYTIERTEGPLELRRYPAMVAAEVVTGGSRQDGVRAGFSPLARYIFARDRAGEKIAMTAPVTQTPGEKIAMTAPVTQTAARDGAWQVRFLMPAGRTLADLPPPAGEVRLIDLPPQRMAAIRFSGAWSDAAFAEAEARLADWIGAEGLTPSGPPTYAYYNDPFTPSFLRRNEVMIPVAD